VRENNFDTTNLKPPKIQTISNRIIYTIFHQMIETLFNQWSQIIEYHIQNSQNPSSPSIHQKYKNFDQK